MYHAFVHQALLSSQTILSLTNTENKMKVLERKPTACRLVCFHCAHWTLNQVISDSNEKLTKLVSLLRSLPSSKFLRYCQSNKILIHSWSLASVDLDTNLFHEIKCRRRFDDLCRGIRQHFDHRFTMNCRVPFAKYCKRGTLLLRGLLGRYSASEEDIESRNHVFVKLLRKGNVQVTDDGENWWFLLLRTNRYDVAYFVCTPW